MAIKILTKEKKNIAVGDIVIGQDPVLIAGPCAVESREQLIETAKALKDIGVHILRGSIFKPRTSPYDFQGLGIEGLKYLKEASEITGLLTITEVMEEKYLEEVAEVVDIIQIGLRNMYNYPLLKAAGALNKPVLLKRGMSATIKEWTMAAEYLAANGNENIILCERGIRSFDDYTRNTLDLAAVPIMQKETGLPVIVDPSHGTGIKSLIKPMSLAAVAGGADGLMIEVHIRPEEALCDGKQSLTPSEYGEIVKALKDMNLLER